MPYTVTETSKSRLNTLQEARDYAYRQSNSFSSQSQLSVRNPRVYSIRVRSKKTPVLYAIRSFINVYLTFSTKKI